MLFAHIVDFYLRQFAETQSHLQRLAGVVGVDVYLNHGLVSNHNHTVAHGIKLNFKPLDIVD